MHALHGYTVWIYRKGKGKGGERKKKKRKKKKKIQRGRAGERRSVGWGMRDGGGK